MDDRTKNPGKIFVGGLSPDIDEGKLKEHFGALGELTDVVVMRDRDMGLSRGFGFVTFADPDVARRVAADKYAQLASKQVELKLAVPRDELPPTDRRRARGAPPFGGAAAYGAPFMYGGSPAYGAHDPRRAPSAPGGVDRRYGGGPSEAYDPSFKVKKAFVGGLGHHVSEQDFEAYFRRFGEVEVATIMRASDGTSRGFGFVTFGSELACDKACFSGPHTLGGRSVEVKKAVPRDRMAPAGDRRSAGPPGAGLGLLDTYGGFGSMAEYEAAVRMFGRPAQYGGDFSSMMPAFGAQQMGAHGPMRGSMAGGAALMDPFGQIAQHEAGLAYGAMHGGPGRMGALNGPGSARLPRSGYRGGGYYNPY